jgi:hypothetical protein
MRILIGLIIIILFFNSPCFSQGSFSNTGSGLNDLRPYMTDDSTTAEPTEDETDEENLATNEGEFDITMEETDSTITFSGLPEKNKVVADITNTEGDLILEKTVGTKNNTVNVRRLSKQLYFVTVSYGKYRKGFTLDRSGKDEEKAEKKKKLKTKLKEDD